MMVLQSTAIWPETTRSFGSQKTGKTFHVATAKNQK